MASAGHSENECPDKHRTVEAESFHLSKDINIVSTLQAVRRRKVDTKPFVKSSLLSSSKSSHPSKEVALKAAKMAVRGKSGMYFGSMENGKGFHVYRNGKVVERHWVESR